MREQHREAAVDIQVPIGTPNAATEVHDCPRYGSLHLVNLVMPALYRTVVRYTGPSRKSIPVHLGDRITLDNWLAAVRSSAVQRFRIIEKRV
jgi:hypothetical protein